MMQMSLSVTNFSRDFINVSYMLEIPNTRMGSTIPLKMFY